MSNLSDDIQSIFLTELKKLAPSILKNADSLKDNSSKALGFTKLTKKGYTP